MSEPTIYAIVIASILLVGALTFVAIAGVIV